MSLTHCRLYYTRVFQGWAYQEQYDQLELCINNSDCAMWDDNSGWSHINGRVYRAAILFNTAEDKLFYKLKFPEILK